MISLSPLDIVKMAIQPDTYIQPLDNINNSNSEDIPALTDEIKNERNLFLTSLLMTIVIGLGMYLTEDNQTITVSLSLITLGTSLRLYTLTKTRTESTLKKLYESLNH